jgi:hypothetical protein
LRRLSRPVHVHPPGSVEIREPGGTRGDLV